MDEFKEKFVQLLHYPNITWNQVYKLLKRDPTLQTLDCEFHYHFPPMPNLLTIPQESSRLPLTSIPTDTIHEQIRQYKPNEISVITIFDKEYPRALKEIYQPPWVLYAKGDLSLLEKEPMLAVVGSRQATQYGKSAIRLIFPELIEHNFVIVSGLAKGIDALAHEQTIRLGGRTIAVIAGGLYHIYPKENIPLATHMMKTQLILSEYPLTLSPLGGTFQLVIEL